MKVVTTSRLAAIARRPSRVFPPVLIGILLVVICQAVAAPIIATNGAVLTAESCASTNGVIDPGETVTVSFSLRNTGMSDTTNLVATLQAAGGVISPSGPQSYGALVAGSSAAAQPFTFTANGTCGSAITATFQLQDGAANLGTVSFNFQLGPTVTILSESFDSVTPTNLPAGWTPTNATGTSVVWTTTSSVRDTLPNSAFAPDLSAASDNRLTSPIIPISSVAAQLTFRHSFNVENGFDGGRLEISLGGGAFTNITAAGGAFISNGYNGTILFGSTPAWTGNSGGFITTKVDLPASAAGQNVQLRWRLTTDSSNAGGPYSGWYVDTVSLSEVQCCRPTNSADLSLTVSDSPDPVLVESNLTYTLRVTNRGPATASAVMLTNTLPSGVTNVVSITTSQGTCTNIGDIIGCNLSSLSNNAGATVTIIVKPSVPGTITNIASVTASQTDFDLLNNSVTTLTTVNLPSLSINDVSATEGNSGTANVNFTITLSPASSKTVTVAYATQDRTAVAGWDYNSTSGTLTYNPGQTSKTIIVAVRGDTLSEASEVFSVVLSNPTNAMLAKAQGDCTINDNDTVPTLSINNVGVAEGNSGTTDAVFTLTLSAASGQAVMVDFATTNDTAIAGVDYVDTSDTITFDVGQTNQTITVPVIGDTLNEANETFFVNLANPVGATINDGQGVCTITNDDLLPNIGLTGATLSVESCLPTNGAIDPGESVSVSFTLKNTSTGTAQTTNLTATLLATGGIVSPSAPQNYGALTAGNSASKTFNFTANGICGGTITASFQLQDGPNDLGTVSTPLTLGAPVTVFSQNFDGVTAPNLPSGWTAGLTGTGSVWVTTAAVRDTLPNSVFGPDPDGTSDNRLTSPAIPISTASAQLTFRHNYNTEAFLDGGVLEIAIDGGPFTNVTSVGGSFVTGGYNGTINGGTKAAWTGTSGAFVTTKLNLPPAAAGQTIQLRWRFLSDFTVGATGWYVDTVSITDGANCCGSAPPPSLVATLSGTNVLVSWSTNATGYVLQAVGSFSSSNSWAYVTNIPTVVADRYVVTQAVTNHSRFYRLIE